MEILAVTDEGTLEREYHAVTKILHPSRVERLRGVNNRSDVALKMIVLRMVSLQGR